MSGFKSLLILQFLSDSHETFTHVLCANTHKTVEHIFKILILKFLSNFLNFAFGQSGTAAAELSRRTGLSSLSYTLYFIAVSLLMSLSLSVILQYL